MNKFKTGDVVKLDMDKTHLVMKDVFEEYRDIEGVVILVFHEYEPCEDIEVVRVLWPKECCLSIHHRAKSLLLAR